MILGRYYGGVIVNVVEDTGGEWVKVRIGDPYGYIMRKYLTFGQDIRDVRYDGPTMKTAVRTDLRHNRWEGDMTAGQLEAGTELQIAGLTDEDMVHVRISESYVYVNCGALE